MHIPAWSQTHYVAEGDFEFLIFLPPPLSAEIAGLAHVELGAGLRASWVIHKHPTN